MRICIHRGTHEIGGSCVEIESQDKRIVLDVGLPLDSGLEDVPLPNVSGFENPDPSLLGIIISHPHLDHYGLSPKLPRSLKVLIGPAAVNILKVSKLFVPHGVEFDKIIPLKDGVQIQFGPFGVTPYLVDHSAYDAYAILVEADGKRLFYTGDFRSHGRKGKLFDKLISHPPRNVDVLLMEGSTLGRTGIDNEYPKETDLEGKFHQIFKSAKGMALVWCSGQNIDRLVTVYRAARRSGRQLIADMYTASVLRAIGNPRLPQPGWAGFRVFLPWNQKRTIIDKKLFEFSQSFSDHRIYPEQLEHDAGKSVILFRPSMRIDLEKANCLQNSILIYSLWSGYLEQYKPFLNWLKSKSIPMHYCHTSGHASLLDLKEFARAINAKMLVPIHTFQPEEFSNHFKNVVQKEDGEWWEPELHKSKRKDYVMEANDRLNTEKLTKQINAERGVRGKWPASFDYKIEPNRITLEINRKIDKSGYRCLDSWGIAILNYAKAVFKSNINRLSFVINKNGYTWTPNAEAFKRRASYLNINIDNIDIDVEYNHKNISLYTKKALFNRPNNEIIRDYLKDRGDDDKGDLLEKAFQAFLFGKDLGTDVRTNDRLAILGEHFYKLKKKQYGVLREFPTGAFDNKISNASRITPTEFIDIVTLNRWGYLSVIELKLDDPKLEVMAQILDYALYFACYRKKLLKVIEKNFGIVPSKSKIMCYVVNNRYHARFMDIYKYYSAKDKNYPFRIFKVVLGDTVE